MNALDTKIVIIPVSVMGIPMRATREKSEIIANKIGEGLIKYKYMLKRKTCSFYKKKGRLKNGKIYRFPV